MYIVYIILYPNMSHTILPFTYFIVIGRYIESTKLEKRIVGRDCGHFEMLSYSLLI